MSKPIPILTKSNSCSPKSCLIQPTYDDYLLNVKKPNAYVPQKKQDEYLKIENFFSEYSSESDKLRARINLGIEGLAYWGNIQGYIEDQEDLIDYIKNNNITQQEQFNESLANIQVDFKNKLQQQTNILSNKIETLAGSNIKGGFQTVQNVNDLYNIPQSKLQDGMLAFVISQQKHYSYVESENVWKEAKFGGGGIPLYTSEQLDQLEQKNDVPSEYIAITTPQNLNGSISNNTYTTSINGTYLDILFQAIRSLQSEVSKLKNTFYYGIQSYNGTDTASSNIILTEEQEEKEPLWALDPEDLSEFEDHSILIGPDCKLAPSTNLNFKENCIEILGEVHQDVDLNFEEAPETKQCVFIVADIKENANITINLGGDNVLNLNLTQFVSRSKCNILLIINRKSYDEDLDQYKGKNYIWLQITDNQRNVINTGYISNNRLVSSEAICEERYHVSGVTFNNITLYKCNFYSKSSGFTNDDVLSSLTPNEDFTFRAAHLAIRSVSTKDVLLQVKNRLLENELVLVESEGQLYIKNKNQLISLSSKTTTDNEVMTSEQILNILKDAGYITTSGDLDSATLNAIESLTFIHSESGQRFNMQINSDGKLIIDQNVNVIPDNWNPGNELTYNKRGAVGHYTLGNNFDKTDTEAPLAIYGNSDDPKAYGDRVRFGSWYVPVKDQTTFGCSHDFIELANSGSVDYPLEGSRLFLVKGSIETETTGEGENQTVSNYLVDASLHKFTLKGVIKSGSTYLIRGKKHEGNTFVINVDSYDYELREGNDLFSLEGVVGMILLNASNTPDISFAPLQHKLGTKDIYYFSSSLHDNKHTNKGSFDTTVRCDLIDCVGFNNAEAFRVTSSDKTGKKEALGQKVYNVMNNHIVKDFFELDPSRQGYLSLTTKNYESTGYRINKVNAEYLNLNNQTISFPHSDEEAEIARFTPKASYENKTICTDKTPLNTVKPNMVSCFFGIDMQTTRCFNWVSGCDQNEYVWIRQKGETDWSRFESYKGDSSEISDINNSHDGVMSRVKYTQPVINSVYKRMKGIFPGSNYHYTAHKCIVYLQQAPTTQPITYEYLVGATLNNGLPNTDKCSNLQTFTLYPSDWQPMVYHISDQQGFEWTEYQVWAASAKQMLKQINEECNSSTKKFPVLINTGDCTQNGTRYNEWLDYYNAGYCLFDHLEQLNVVGNNDLANAYDHSVLGTGNDEGKSNPYYFHLVNCYQLDNEENYQPVSGQDYLSKWQHPLIYNNVYFPSTYYTYFDSFGYLLINSELTKDTCKGLFKANVVSGNDTLTYNLYTGYLENQTKQSFAESQAKGRCFKNAISNMLDKLSGKKVIVACHEMPFTVITVDNLQGDKYRVDRSCNGDISGGSVTHKSLVGSHMNRLRYNANWDNDDNYWFSQLLQNKGVKLCIGGHKHSYACTYPVYENPELIYNLVKNTDGFKDYDPSKLFVTITDRIVESDKLTLKDDSGNTITNNALYECKKQGAYSLLRAPLSATIDGISLIDKAVTYFMVQATGYKLKSNKELPSVNQTFSIIRPKTNLDNTAHYSQESPMFATIDYNSNQWGISLYRIVNIKTTAATKITEFSSIKYSTKPMVTERLILNYSESEGANENYWYTTDPTTNYSFNYTTADSDRCWGLSNNKVQIKDGTIDYTNYTLTVQL